MYLLRDYALLGSISHLEIIAELPGLFIFTILHHCFVWESLVSTGKLEPGTEMQELPSPLPFPYQLIFFSNKSAALSLTPLQRSLRSSPMKSRCLNTVVATTLQPLLLLPYSLANPICFPIWKHLLGFFTPSFWAPWLLLKTPPIFFFWISTLCC